MIVDPHLAFNYQNRQFSEADNGLIMHDITIIHVQISMAASCANVKVDLTGNGTECNGCFFLSL